MRPWRTEACLCGLAITAPDGDWEAIAEAVRRHQRTPEHAAWRLGMRLRRAGGTWTRDGLGVRVAS